jgi:general secretion pathway protein G
LARAARGAHRHRRNAGRRRHGADRSVDVRAGSEGYPPDLETLVEGVAVANDASGRKLKFLRKIPIDPMTNSTEWGLRSYSGQA